MRRILRRYAGSGYGFALLWHALTFLAGFIYSGIAGRWKFVERTVSAGKDLHFLEVPWHYFLSLSPYKIQGDERNFEGLILVGDNVALRTAPMGDGFGGSLIWHIVAIRSIVKGKIWKGLAEMLEGRLLENTYISITSVPAVDVLANMPNSKTLLAYFGSTLLANLL